MHTARIEAISDPAAATASTLAPVEHAAGSRTWFAWQRDARSVARFRAVTGLALCVFFVRQQRESAALFDSGLLATSLGSSHWLAAFPLSACLGAGAVLALLLAFGAWPRTCAALLVPIAIGAQRAFAPIARLDDWAAVVLLFWLLLLPSTRFEHAVLRKSGTRIIDAPARISGAVASLFLVHVLLAYVWLDGWRALSPAWPALQESPWLAVAVGLLPGLYLLPLGPLRVLGPTAQLALHGYLGLHTGEWLAHATLAASSLLLFGDRTPTAGSNSAHSAARSARHGSAARIDGAFVLAACYTLVLVLAAWGGKAHAVTAARRARHVLVDLGLAPTPPAAALPQATLAFREGRSRSIAWSELAALPDARSVRTQLVWSHLIARSQGARSAVTLGVSEHALRAVARAFCDARGSAHATQLVQLVLDDLRRPEPRVLASFDCRSPDRTARFLPTES